MNQSTYSLLGWPNEVPITLFVFGFICTLVPYLAGFDFGVFKVPKVSDKVARQCKYFGPILSVLILLGFFPAWAPSEKATETVDPAEPQFQIHGTIELEEEAVLPKTAMVALLWGLEDDDHYCYGTAQIIQAADKTMQYEITLREAQPPEKALMFLTNIRPRGEPGESTPSLVAKLGIAYIFVFDDTNGTGVFEPSEDKALGASASHCVSFLSGKLPKQIEHMQQLEQGFGLTKAVPPNDTFGFDNLVPVNPETKINITITNDYKIQLPNWT